MFRHCFSRDAVHATFVHKNRGKAWSMLMLLLNEGGKVGKANDLIGALDSLG